MCKRSDNNSGFTLVEILIVVVILGILAAIVVPAYSSFSSDAEKNAFITDLRSFISAAEYYRSKTGDFLAEADPATAPDGWEAYVDIRKWARPTPIGGRWEIRRDTGQFRSAIGVNFSAATDRRPSDESMQHIDSAFDDGSLQTGRFRKIDDDRYYFILAD